MNVQTSLVELSHLPFVGTIDGLFLDMDIEDIKVCESAEIAVREGTLEDTYGVGGINNGSKGISIHPAQFQVYTIGLLSRIDDNETSLIYGRIRNPLSTNPVGLRNPLPIR